MNKELQEIHIVSLVIHALPEHIDDVVNKAGKLPQAECHREAQHNKFVLVFEAEKESEISSTMDDITHWQGAFDHLSRVYSESVIRLVALDGRLKPAAGCSRC